MKRRKVRYRVRKFLNKPGYHSVAFIYGSIGDGVVLKIGDCNRVIDLDFSAYGSDKANALYKAKLLATTLTEFAEKLEEHLKLGGSGEDDWLG